MPRIELSSYEIFIAAQAGIMRQVENLKLGRAPAYGIDDDKHWQVHIEGCLGECALAKYLDIFWAGKGQLRAPDVGEVDVRTTWRTNGCLLLHECDPDDRIFWLVCGINGSYDVKGWIPGREGKMSKFWGDPTNEGRAAFFVPQTALYPPGQFCR